MARGVGRVLAVSLIVGTLVGPSGLAGRVGSAQADPVVDRRVALERQIAQLRDDLEGSSKDLVEAMVTLRRSADELVDVRVELAAAQQALAQAQRRDAEFASRLAFAQAEEAKAAHELSAQVDAEADTRAALGQIARETYASAGPVGLAIALDAQTPDQYADRMAIAASALRAQDSTVDRLAVEESQSRARGARLAAVRAQVADLKVGSEMAVATRQRMQSQAEATEQRQSELVAGQAAAVALIKARMAAERVRLAAADKEDARLRAVLAARARAAAVRAARDATRHHHRLARPSSGSGVLSFPVGAPITSGFGMRFHPILHYWRLHAGTDFGAPCGTPVYAAADGVVLRASWAGGYGNQLIIDHGFVHGVSLATGYNHLSRIVARRGSVHRGALVAYSGTTGLSTGCHLHFEVFVNGVHVNPMGWL